MNTNEDTKKKSFPKAIVMLVVLALVLGIGFAYARYVTSLNGGTQAPIANWNFKVTAGSTQSLSIDLATTRFLDDTTEVDRTKVAPGTKGAIILNVDATGSQVSLQYNIDLSLTQIPENLVFYYDEKMENAMYKENGKIHLDGYFQANDANKTVAKTLYWQWKLETGSTPDEIDSNDTLDSEWMGEQIKLGIEATGRQIMDEPTTQYNVTFDLNGGTLANHGDSKQITKQVNYGEAYGDLPVPTRQGYTFKGWNGKNKINIDKAVNNSLIDNNDGTYTMWHNYEGRFSNRLYIYIPANTVLALSCDVLEYNGTYFQPFQLFWGYTDGTTTTSSGKGRMRLEKNINWVMIYQEGSQPRGTYTKFKNLQIEENSTATEYEPYYVLSSTPVTQNKNHTLKARWEKIND